MKLELLRTYYPIGNQWKDSVTGQMDIVLYRTPLEEQPRTGFVYTRRKV